MQRFTTVKAYYELTKPGIIYGNILTAIAGFLLGSKWRIDAQAFFAMLFGTSLVIGSACVLNNYIDRDIDHAMARTKKRALVSGQIKPRNALGYAITLGAAGFGLLIAYSNILVVYIGAVAFIDYVILYGLSKRHSTLSTLVGSVSGSAPIVAGYVAAVGHFDLGALLLFLILTCWQMPHFYAIGMYRVDDYAAAHLPILPVEKGMHHTKMHIVSYIVAFNVAIVSLALYGYAGYAYATVMLGLGLVWLFRGIQGFKAADDKKWARGMFFYSLIVIMALSATLSVGSILP
ncbi:MAG: heme o synthase [Candidatus Saccharibacteria bacterium]